MELETAVLTVELSNVATWIMGITSALILIIGWFIRHELKNNDKAHADLTREIKTINTKVSDIDSKVSDLGGKLDLLIRVMIPGNVPSISAQDSKDL